MSEPPAPWLPKPLRLALGLPVAFAVGFLSALAGIPAPSPVTLLGALIVAAMTAGYLLADRFLVSRPSGCVDACAGPSGVVRSAPVRRP